MAPEPVFYRDGQVEGVKYDRIGVGLINAVKEQQAQIEQQRNSSSDNRSKIKRSGRSGETAAGGVCSATATARRFEETGMPEALARSGVPMKK